jgi:hypothetical protein
LVLAVVVEVQLEEEEGEDMMKMKLHNHPQHLELTLALVGAPLACIQNEAVFVEADLLQRLETEEATMDIHQLILQAAPRVICRLATRLFLQLEGQTICLALALTIEKLRFGAQRCKFNLQCPLFVISFLVSR